jgi:hypothetical protein
VGRECGEDGLGGDVPYFGRGIIRAGENLCRGKRGEFGDMDGLFVGVKGAENGA